MIQIILISDWLIQIILISDWLLQIILNSDWLFAGVNESSEVQIRSIATFSKQQDMMLQENNEKLCQAVTQLTKRADDFNSEL